MKFKQWSNYDTMHPKLNLLIVHTIQGVCSLELHFKMIVACIKTQQKDNPSLIKNIQSTYDNIMIKYLTKT